MIYLFVIRSSIRRTILVAVFATVAMVSQDVVAQYKYHTAPPKGVGMMRGQANEQLPSILLLDDGRRVKTAEDWWGKKRPELVKHWTEILGKLGPGPADEKWFGDITQIEIVNEVQCEGYRRLEVLLPMEKDFKQPHLLLIPDDVGDEPLPSVIAWTSTSPDYRQPEVWWGEWLAKRGFVVLTGWSFIRNYRQGTTYNTGAHELVYQRFGHWLSMGKMIHDVRREAEFLQSLPEVDKDRIGFIGFSLSAKTALYVAAFATEVKATVSIDPHLPIYGDSNYAAPWYLDFTRRFDTINTPTYPAEELRGTPWSLLDQDPLKPGFERNHHELLAMAAPRSLLVIGCSADQVSAKHSDDRQSIGYVERAREVFELLDMPQHLEYLPLSCGHRATSPEIDEAWHAFFVKWLAADAKKESK